MITFMRPAVRRLGAALVTATLAGAALAAPAAAQDPEAGSGASRGSLPGAGLGLSNLLALATTGSASNENAPLLAPLSSGFGPLSAAPDTPGYGSAVTPAMLGVTLMLSLVPVGSLAAATQVLAGVGSGERVDAAIGSLTGRGPASPEPDPTISRSEALAKTPVDDPIVPGRLEIWTVTSVSMGRKVELEVFLPGGDGPAPMLYSLDDIDTLLPSGFRTRLPARGGHSWKVSPRSPPPVRLPRTSPTGFRTILAWAATSGRPSSIPSCRPCWSRIRGCASTASEA